MLVSYSEQTFHYSSILFLMKLYLANINIYNSVCTLKHNLPPSPFYIQSCKDGNNVIMCLFRDET